MLVSNAARIAILYGIMALLILSVGHFQTWTLALTIVNLCLISAIMALGVNMQWGYAGLFNVGIMGFAALGGVAAVLVSMPPVGAAWSAGGFNLGLALLMIVGTVGFALFARERVSPAFRGPVTLIVAVVGYFAMRIFLDPASDAIEAVNPAAEGYLGGLGLPILISWAVGGLFAAGAAYLVGKLTLGLRSDYLAIATLGISEIILAVLKNENWLTRGVKNVTGIPRPFPPERELQATQWVIDLGARFGADPTTAAAIVSRLGYAILFAAVLIAIFWLCERALHSPWGRMMRAIRDNEDAARAMGKDVPYRRLEAFIFGSALMGLGGALFAHFNRTITPEAIDPMVATFLVWIMLILGGSGNNRGAILGVAVVWIIWSMSEIVTDRLPHEYAVQAKYLRVFLIGLMLQLVLRFRPEGLLPEPQKRGHRPDPATRGARPPAASD